MARKILFQKPFGVTVKGVQQYRAMVNGEWVQGTFAEVDAKYNEGKKAKAKAERDAKHVCLASYRTGTFRPDGKPAQALGYYVGKQAMISIPARLNNYKSPSLKEAAAILRGETIKLG